MSIMLALYKGPAIQWQHKAAHWAICAVLSMRHLRWCPYSHAELVVDGICYSSSIRDGGVRRKAMNLDSGRWVLQEVKGIDKDAALSRFAERQGAGYDWPGALRWALPFLKQRPKADYCFEVVAYMLDLPEPSRWTALDLENWARAA